MRSYFFLACIVGASIVPFCSRAVFIDEHIYLRIAQTAQHNWLFPQDEPSVFFGLATTNDVAITHPPVGQYYLALTYRMWGRFSEVAFRLAFSLFSVAAVLAFYNLARRFTREAFWIAALFALTPAFFVISATLMMDMPMIAFLLAGLALYFAHLDGRKFALPAAAACWVLALGTGYTAVIPLGCLGLQMALLNRPLKEWLAVASAPAVVMIWQLMMSLHFGGLPLARTAGFFIDRGSMLHNAAATLSFVGGVTLFPWTALLVSKRPRILSFCCIAGIVVLFALLITASFPTRVWYVILALSGGLILLVFFNRAKSIIRTGVQTEWVFVFWVPCSLLFFILVSDMITARYVLLCVPALYLVILRTSTARQLITVLIPTAILSVVLAYADFVFVNSYRDWVVLNVPELQRQGFRIWGAAESGLRFYLEQRGIPTLTAVDLRPRGVDLVVRHDLFHYGLSEDVETMLTVLKRFPLVSRFPVQTFNRASGAGFHDSRIGITPFAFSAQTLDYVEVSQMSPFVAALPQKGIPADEVPAWSPNGVILKQAVDRREFNLRVPAGVEAEYQIVGDGTVEIRNNNIVLHRISPGTIVWTNFCFMPRQFASSGN